jgi:hypothetical protein
MVAGFVCNLGWWFGRDYGLVRGDGVILELVMNRGGANVLLLPVFFWCREQAMLVVRGVVWCSFWSVM